MGCGGGELNLCSFGDAPFAPTEKLHSLIENCTHVGRNTRLQAAALSGLYTCGGGEALLDPEPGKDKLSRRMATAACCAAGRLRGKYCIML